MRQEVRAKFMLPVDILILSNGPGEITTWVRPVVRALRSQLGDDRATVRISVMLSPCPHATGTESAIATGYAEVDRVQGSEHFFRFLLGGKTADLWDWHERGVVLFLGGDQVYAVLIGKRLGYRTVIYAEWEARWYRLVDHFGVRDAAVSDKLPVKYRAKCTVIGDLMADIASSTVNESVASPTIALMPGSKPGKLRQGVPFSLAIAEEIHRHHPQTRFILPVAPTLNLSTLARFADPKSNPMVGVMGGVSAQLVVADGNARQVALLKTSGALSVELITEFPAHEHLRQCSLAITTVGANTAELGALGIPMLVLLPTQQLDAMRTLDGMAGLLASLPFLRSALTKGINWFVLRRKHLFAWPNIWAGEEIVPELVGFLEVTDVSQRVLDWLAHPEKLALIRDRLRQVRAQTGAASQLAKMVEKQLSLLDEP